MIVATVHVRALNRYSRDWNKIEASRTIPCYRRAVERRLEYLALPSVASILHKYTIPSVKQNTRHRLQPSLSTVGRNVRRPVRI